MTYEDLREIARCIDKDRFIKMFLQGDDIQNDKCLSINDTYLGTKDTNFFDCPCDCTNTDIDNYCETHNMNCKTCWLQFVDKLYDSITNPFYSSENKDHLKKSIEQLKGDTDKSDLDKFTDKQMKNPEFKKEYEKLDKDKPLKYSASELVEAIKSGVLKDDDVIKYTNNTTHETFKRTIGYIRESYINELLLFEPYTLITNKKILLKETMTDKLLNMPVLKIPKLLINSCTTDLIVLTDDIIPDENKEYIDDCNYIFEYDKSNNIFKYVRIQSGHKTMLIQLVED